MKKNAFVVIYLFLLTVPLMNTTIGVSAPIPFTNINMVDDDVLNYEGVRIVLFFKPSCPSCHNQIVTLKQLENVYNLSIIALDVDSETTNDTLIDFKNDLLLSVNWTLGYASSQSISLFSLTVVPSQVILDNNSEIVAVTEGYFDYDSLELKILDAIYQRTENYNPNPINDSSDLLTALFIILGVAITTIVIVILIRFFRKSDKTANIFLASKKLEQEEEEKEKVDN